MNNLPLSTFDPNPYMRAPRGDVLGMLALARALVELWPKEASRQIDRNAEALHRLVLETEASLTARHRESTRQSTGKQLALAMATSSLWTTLRNRLEAWRVFEHPGLKPVMLELPKRSTAAVVLTQASKKAERARELKDRLFGSKGVEFVRLPLPKQARRMASLLRLIDEDGLATSIDQLAGPELMIALLACQSRFEAMVESRMSRRKRTSANLRKLLPKLRRAIARYTNSVLTLVDDDDPESLEVVLAALHPMDVLRGRRSRSAGSDDPKLELVETVEAEPEAAA